MTSASVPAASTFAQRIADDLDNLVALRRHLHAHPELSDREHNTARLIARELADLGLETRTGLAGGTGVIASIPATRPDAPTVALRADIDALPIHEATGLPWASTLPGVMHACGHDGHTAILIGAARALANADERPNNVLLIFQPAEEHGGGAERMCQQGVLGGADAGGLGRPVDRIFGLHGWPLVELGRVATRPGPLLASTDDFDITIAGVGGHAAMPHLACDPIVAASAAVLNLQAIASRSVAPADAAVVTVGSFQAGTADNIIPASARLLGTVRALREDTRGLLERRLREVVASTAAAHGCRADVVFKPGYPVTANDPDLARHVLDVAGQTLGPDHAQLAPEASMGGEDFSYYGQHVPACFFLLGLMPHNADQAGQPLLHQPTFDFNDDAIATGVAMMCALAGA